MMDTQVDAKLLEKIADMLGKPVGAFNIRKDWLDGRQSTEHIKIDDRTDGQPASTSASWTARWVRRATSLLSLPSPALGDGVQRLYIGENCNVKIVAGCGIHNCGDQDPP